MKRSTRSYANRLKNLNVFILVIGIVLCAVNADAAKKRTINAEWTARVVGITDGDTITVLTPTLEEVKIRLYGVDAPERKQAFGTKAREFLASLVFGQDVIIHPTGRDLYGRTVAKVFINGRDVGLTCIEYGYCWWYRDYAKNETLYKKAQEKASKQELGLWADDNPVAPWKFRKAKKGSE